MLEKNLNNIKDWLTKNFNNQENDKIRNFLVDILNSEPSFDKVFFDKYFDDICFIIHRFSHGIGSSIGLYSTSRRLVENHIRAE